jgi:hypothetical protein
MTVVFGKGSITKDTWEDMRGLVERNEISTVLEIGCGSSTVLLSHMVASVVSLETSDKWIKQVALENQSGRISFIKYVYPSFPELPAGFDMAFVDGPAGLGDGRIESMRFAAAHSSLVLIHDSYRAKEKAAIAEVFGKGWRTTRKRGGLLVAYRETHYYDI